MELNGVDLNRTAADEETWRREMLKYAVTQAVLLEEACKDHREFRAILYRALGILIALAVAIGIPVGVML